MKVLAFSDTHGISNFELPDADVLVFAGDLSSVGEKRDIIKFAEILSKKQYQHKLVIAGNHDLSFDRHPRAKIPKHEAIAILESSGIVYLENSGYIIDEVKFWGSPMTPEFYNWAFMASRDEMHYYWDLIPDDIDFLITHGPPKGILDKTVSGQSVGCQALLERVLKIKPKFHIFGHIHEAYGHTSVDGISFYNVSMLDHRYALVNDPIIIEVNKKGFSHEHEDK
jgi:Icc-related predicted phosphoesterase